jgi:hypothetical protein
MDDKLDTQQIAEFLRVTRQHVTNTLTKSPGFPAPVINRSRRLKFWRKEDVERWAAGEKRCAS